MTDGLEHMMWAYRAVFKQTDVGGGHIIVTITANERMEVLYCLAGPNDYAANRTLTSDIRDSAGNQVGKMTPSLALDNATMASPAFGSGAAITIGHSNEFNQKFTLGQDDSLRFAALSLVQNEELTIAIRALIDSVKPTIATTGSGGTVTITTTYDRVI